MANGTGERRITWQVVAIAACILLVSTSGLVLKGFDSRLAAAESNIKLKIDRSEHDKDMSAIKEMFQLIREDLKRHEDNAERRRR